MIIERPLHWIIYVLCISLFFFPIKANNYVLILLIIFCLYRIRLTDFKQLFSQFKITHWLVLLFVVQLIGLIYASNLKAGLFILEKKISFLALPIFLLPVFTRTITNYEIVCKRIGQITLLGSIGLIIFAFYRKYALGYENAFYFESFRDFEGFSPIHYVYFSMFFAFGSLLFIEAVFDDLIKRKYGLLMMITLFLYSLGIIILVASKTGILAFSIASIALIFFKLNNKQIVFAFVISILVALACLLYFNETTRERFYGLTNNIDLLTPSGPPNHSEFTDLNMRLVFWEISLTHLWQDHLILFGVGTGDAQDYINSLYNLPQYKITGYIDWDSHNQWVFSLIQNGLFGLLFLGLLFVFAVKKALAERNIKFIVFLIIVIFFSLTESILESNKGIVFFTLFITLFSSLEMPMHKIRSS